MEKFLYFADANGANATGESYFNNAKNLRGGDITAAAATTLYFKPLKIGDAVATSDVNDGVVVTHTGQTGKEFLTALAQAIGASGSMKENLIVVADGNTNTGIGSGTAWSAATTLAA